MSANSVNENDPFVAKLAAQMQLILDELAKTHAIRQPGTGVLVALSGGPDSCSLLLALHALQSTLRIRLSACHVNHSLRGEESDQDEQFCVNLCQNLAVPLLVKKLAAPASDEATLRELRYAGLSTACAETASQICVTGHNMDDQVETVLFRLFRGTMLNGLTGIAPLRKTESDAHLARPMLSIRRSDCLDFLDRNLVPYRQDSSNNNTTYARNYIRRIILPAIEDRFPGATERIERTRKVLAQDEAELATQALEALKVLEETNWDLKVINSLPASLKLRALTGALQERGVEPSFRRIEQINDLIDGITRTTITLNSTWSLTVQRGRLEWIDSLDKGRDNRPLEQIPEYVVNVPGLTIMPRFNLCLRVQQIMDADSPEFPPANALEILADLSRANGAVKLRARHPGDKIVPLGMSCEVRLKQYLHTRKTEGLLRFWGHTVVLADDIGVMWVPGCGISERIAVRARDMWRVTISSLAPDASSFC